MTDAPSIYDFGMPPIWFLDVHRTRLDALLHEFGFTGVRYEYGGTDVQLFASHSGVEFDTVIEHAEDCDEAFRYMVSEASGVAEMPYGTIVRVTLASGRVVDAIYRGVHDDDEVYVSAMDDDTMQAIRGDAISTGVRKFGNVRKVIVPADRVSR